jgi:hypothetical protein
MSAVFDVEAERRRMIDELHQLQETLMTCWVQVLRRDRDDPVAAELAEQLVRSMVLEVSITPSPTPRDG